jgi:hypothetical protein
MTVLSDRCHLLLSSASVRFKKEIYLSLMAKYLILRLARSYLAMRQELSSIVMNSVFSGKY